MKSVVILHEEHGVYLGSFMGLGFFSILDSAGQWEATTFIDQADAREYIRSWDNANNPNDYRYIAVDCVSEGKATVEELQAAGLEKYLGDMVTNEGEFLRAQAEENHAWH